MKPAVAVGSMTGACRPWKPGTKQTPPLCCSLDTVSLVWVMSSYRPTLLTPTQSMRWQTDPPHLAHSSTTPVSWTLPSARYLVSSARPSLEGILQATRGMRPLSEAWGLAVTTSRKEPVPIVILAEPVWEHPDNRLEIAQHDIEDGATWSEHWSGLISQDSRDGYTSSEQSWESFRGFIFKQKSKKIHIRSVGGQDWSSFYLNTKHGSKVPKKS